MSTNSAEQVPAVKASKSRRRGIWREKNGQALLLSPVASLYGWMVGLRRWLYQRHIFQSRHPGVPVIVIGNVVAGGAGKTPVVVAVLNHLRQAGWTPGAISRGYGRKTKDCREVTPESAPDEVGDEPRMIAAMTQVPFFVGTQRSGAALALRNAHPEVNILVSDDGLQHMALARDVEICVFNEDGIGNGLLLPAGPLREPWPRKVDAVLYAGAAPFASPDHSFRVTRALAAYGTRQNGQRVALSTLSDQRLHAVAAIARPEMFFDQLEQQGLVLFRTSALPDHYDFESNKEWLDQCEVLICTEKDAAKIWRHRPDALAVPLHTGIDAGFFSWLDKTLHSYRA